MPKINVYVPDGLADLVKATGVPVSAVCQRALGVAAHRAMLVRAAFRGTDPLGGLAEFTIPARSVLRASMQTAQDCDVGNVSSEMLLGALIDEDALTPLHVLRLLEVDPGDITECLRSRRVGPGFATESSRAVGPAATDPRFFSDPAITAVELAVSEAISMGHDHLGCEHLLLGLIAEPAGAAGDLLRSHGVELRPARHALLATLADAVQTRATATHTARPVEQDVVEAMIRTALHPVTERLTRLEDRVGLIDPPTTTG